MVPNPVLTQKIESLRPSFTHKHAQDSITKNQAGLAYTIGNLKIGPDTLIFNMGTATECPSAKLGLCSLAHKKHGGNGKCYALKSEAMYPTPIAFRSIQALQWEHLTAAQIADAIFSEVSASQKRKTPIRFVRFNESGDFYSLSCVRKAGKIAGYVKALCNLAGVPIVKFYTYTHRTDILTGIGGEAILKALPDNLTVNGSNFKAHNEFKVLNISRPERDTKAYGKFTCKDDCSVCSLCKSRHTAGNGITIIQATH